jgi:hypothetical protein
MFCILAHAHVAIPVLGVVMLAIVGAVTLWCYICFRLGIWLACGCTRRYSQPERAAFCAAPNRAVEAPVPPRMGRRKCGRDRPSSSIGMVLVLLLVCLAIFGLRSRNMQRAFAARRPAPESTIKANNDAKNPGWTVTGRGKTLADAEQVAMEDAYHSVVNYVERDLPAPRWVPSSDYVFQRMLKSKQNEEPREFADLGLAEQVTVRVEMSPEDQRDILRRGRMLFLVKILSAIVLILGAIAVYIRMDELSKGYYTGWLRLATAGVVAGAVGGLLAVLGVLPIGSPASLDAETPDRVAVLTSYSLIPIAGIAALGIMLFLSMLDNRKE